MPGRTIADLEARAQKIQIFQLHEETAFNADAETLEGKPQLVSDYQAVWLWFVPADSYDGTVFFEISPDGGETWFAVQGYQPDARTTLISNLASPDTDDGVIIPMPDFSHFRARMNGGSQGSLTVNARLVDIPTSVG